MAGARELQNRMKSIRDTLKITDAMHRIASVKLNKARKNLENTEPYFRMLQGTIARMLRHLPEMEHRYFENGRQSQKRGYIVVAADKGLAGDYNHNIMRLTEASLKSGQENMLFVAGELGREYFQQHHISFYQEFHYAVQDPDLDRAREIGEQVISLYDQGKLDELYVIYTDLVNSMQAEVKVQRLLPLKKEQLVRMNLSDVYAEDIQMLPSAEELLSHVVPSYVTGFIFGALVESYSSEQNCRRMAMEAAADNARKLLKELQMTYHRVRQDAITREITEVMAGARALRRCRRKK